MNKQAQERYEICKSCDKNIHNGCSSCGCYLLAKCRVESEKCLDNKGMN